ncbi:MAG TPA: hypothetical protein VLT89_11915 [Usitatibacter sp.]|nr:hypothetical protein [Usitatibacter sp.]
MLATLPDGRLTPINMKTLLVVVIAVVAVLLVGAVLYLLTRYLPLD